MPNITLESIHFVKGVDPVADFMAGTVSSDVVSLENYDRAIFIIHKGVGATGTSVITVEACDDFTPSNSTAVPFRYQAITSGDTKGAVTEATASGFTTTAGSSQAYLVEVDAIECGKQGYGNVRLVATEDTNSPVIGSIGILLVNSRYGVSVPATAIA